MQLLILFVTFKGSDEGFTRLHAFYPDLIKRLDDSNDEIRFVLSANTGSDVLQTGCAQNVGSVHQVHANRIRPHFVQGWLALSRVCG